MKIFIFVLGSFLSLTSFAATEQVGFQNGNDVSIVELSGNVTYLCHDPLGNNYSAHHYCSGYIASPGTHDYLVSSAPIEADKVTLMATHADGSTRKKEVGFNSEKSISSSSVNLIVSSVLQRPLLEMGNNTIAYTFKNGKKVVAEGSFASTVTLDEVRKCRPRTEFAQNEMYCKNQAMGCDQYYYMEHNCKY